MCEPEYVCICVCVRERFGVFVRDLIYISVCVHVRTSMCVGCLRMCVCVRRVCVCVFVCACQCVYVFSKFKLTFSSVSHPRRRSTTTKAKRVAPQGRRRHKYCDTIVFCEKC